MMDNGHPMTSRACFMRSCQLKQRGEIFAAKQFEELCWLIRDAEGTIADKPIRGRKGRIWHWNISEIQRLLLPKAMVGLIELYEAQPNDESGMKTLEITFKLEEIFTSEERKLILAMVYALEDNLNKAMEIITVAGEPEDLGYILTPRIFTYYIFRRNLDISNFRRIRLILDEGVSLINKAAAKEYFSKDSESVRNKLKMKMYNRERLLISEILGRAIEVVGLTAQVSAEETAKFLKVRPPEEGEMVWQIIPHTKYQGTEKSFALDEIDSFALRVSRESFELLVFFVRLDSQGNLNPQGKTIGVEIVAENKSRGRGKLQPGEGFFLADPVQSKKPPEPVVVVFYRQIEEESGEICIEPLDSDYQIYWMRMTETEDEQSKCNIIALRLLNGLVDLDETFEILKSCREQGESCATVKNLIQAVEKFGQSRGEDVQLLVKRIRNRR